MQGLGRFSHRVNDDGTIDSICPSVSKPSQPQPKRATSIPPKVAILAIHFSSNISMNMRIAGNIPLRSAKKALFGERYKRLSASLADLETSTG